MRYSGGMEKGARTGAPAAKGRGAVQNPANRFERLRVEIDPEVHAADAAGAAGAEDGGRIATEFLRDLYANKAAKRYIAGLKELQDTLGKVHDGAVAAGHVEALEAAAGAGAARAAALLQGWIAANLKRDRKRLVALWRDFAAHKPFWKDA